MSLRTTIVGILNILDKILTRDLCRAFGRSSKEI